jgi:hypothetical protein
MIAGLSLSGWRARGRQRVWAALAALALGFHLVAMASHQPPSAAELALLEAHALCLTSGEAPPAGDHGTPVHPQAPFCPICWTLQAAVPPPQSQSPAIIAFPWAVAHRVDPPAGTAGPPRLVLTDLNPRGPPVLG